MPPLREKAACGQFKLEILTGHRVVPMWSRKPDGKTSGKNSFQRIQLGKISTKKPVWPRRGVCSADEGRLEVAQPDPRKKLPFRL